MAHQLQTEFFTRHALLVQQAKTQENLIAEPLHSPVPTPIKCYDFRTDPTHPINRRVVEYYRVRSIRIKK